MPTDARRTTLLRRTRLLLGFFIVALLASGLTAIPVAWELDVMARALGLPPDVRPDGYVGLARWIALVRQGVRETGERYPFIAYGFDWLAFAHGVLAVVFVGAWRDPVRNLWVVTFGLIACALVIPWALAFGALRGIPLPWRLIDCSFGVFGAIPLWLARRFTVELRRHEAQGETPR